MATSPSPLPKVQLTRLLRDALSADGAEKAALVEEFAEWKKNWPAEEDRNYYFGKDGAYTKPRRNDKHVLWHVHMPPEDPNDWPAGATPLTPVQKAKIEGEIVAWGSAWDKERPARYRVSSRVLVYVDGGRYGYLLIDLGREPNGHDELTANKARMEQWADVAERFQFDGTILI